MKKLKRKLLKWFVLLMILVVLFFYGLKFYVTNVDPMRPKLEAQVQSVEKQYHVHPLSYNEIPLFYRQAVIATEDRRFNSDPGIDPIGIIRSGTVDLLKHKLAQGGSTIAQQLVDNTFLKRNKSLSYKITQSLYAIGIYDTVPKQKVFEMYANIIYFGNGAYGLYNASMTYFHKKPSELNQGELAMLAGLPNSPNNYDPKRHLTLARKREAEVLQNMVDMTYITNAQATHIYNEPIRLKG